MIEHEALPREGGAKAHGLGHLARKDEDVVGKVPAANLPYALTEGLLVEESGGLVLDHMAKAHQTIAPLA